MFILPIFTNTGAATLQLVCAGRVMGTFPIVKGVNTPLAAGDIVKDSPLVVVFSTALSCFSMVNPVDGLFDMARFLEKAQNLADLVDKGAARNNLGLGKLALEDDYPKGSLSQKGIVQLSSATDSDSETMAATPKAVKAAMDLAASPSVKSVNDKKGEVILTPDDIGAFAKTGGTVNGDVIVEGSQLLPKGDNRKHLGFHNQDGSVRMWLYKDKGGDGVRLNNGNDGGGDWVFNKNGHFYSPQALHAAGATYQEDGNVHGAVWGGHLSGYLHNTFSKKVNDYGEIGSYLMALCNTGNIGPNGTVSGENLRTSTVDGIVEGGPLPGMWRCMGNMNTRNDAHRTTLWERIS